MGFEEAVWRHREGFAGVMWLDREGFVEVLWLVRMGFMEVMWLGRQVSTDNTALHYGIQREQYCKIIQL